MKIRQIKLFSWGVALSGILLSLMMGYKAYQQLKNVKPDSHAPTEFRAVGEGGELQKTKMIERGSLLDALSFLFYKEREIAIVTPPLPPETVGVTPLSPVDPPKVPFDPKLTLVLVSYDHVEGKHLAFVKHENKASHPYFKGERLPSQPPTLIKEIFPQSILVISEDGKNQKQIYTKNAIVQKVERSNLTPPSKNSRVNLPQANGRVNSMAAIAKTRRVPRSRSVEINQDYGISVVEYDPTPEGEKRFAISPRDLKILRNQSLRMLSEVSMLPAYHQSGDPKGIQLDFVTENPLAKSYGIQSGDILTHVNGKQVANSYEAENLYNNLDSKTRRVQVSLERNGSPLNIWLEMDDFPGTPNRK